jgi:pilus assembly protein Flp/PilA
MTETLTRMTGPIKVLGRDRKGQDLIEYALMAAAVAVAAGAIFPTTVAPSISAIFSKVTSIMNLT